MSNAAENVRAFLTARTGHADGEPTDPNVAETFDWDTAEPVYLREADLEALLQTIEILSAILARQFENYTPPQPQENP